MICEIEGCARASKVKNLCAACYGRQYRQLQREKRNAEIAEREAWLAPFRKALNEARAEVRELEPRVLALRQAIGALERLSKIT